MKKTEKNHSDHKQTNVTAAAQPTRFFLRCIRYSLTYSITVSHIYSYVFVGAASVAHFPGCTWRYYIAFFLCILLEFIMVSILNVLRSHDSD